ncbi:MAG: UDP-N-acetylmuramoyl-L-alanine--D-glutamate ligase [Actinomycetota bacterium]|nr:UDP-N-acetylmuramoyl-L-alanine--D-glutamate ligase [Actinomycetota bacterium]
MSARPALPRGPWLVVGLARSGIAAARALLARGERVVAVDAGRPEVPDGLDARVGTDGLEELAAVGAVVKSPGVPADAPVVAAARERGMPVLGELELAWRLVPNEVVAVTGTNGKTTTVELLGAMHRAAGLEVAVAGNVGVAYSGLAGRLAAEAVVVCEASSFQLEDTERFAPEGAVLLNVEPDHLDRHGSFDAYLAAKLRAFAHQGPGDVAVAPDGLELPGRARRVAPLADRDGRLWWDDAPLVAHEAIRLRGVHNRANAAAAAALALARGLRADAVREALATFAGVEHRLEEVATVDGVLLVNDSKATNVASTLVALRSFAVPVHLILGGLGKGQDFAPLGEAVRERGVRTYLIGAAEDELAAVVGGERCGDLERALDRALAAARPGEVVLLSPACASFDQFADFEARGRAFKELVAARRTPV